jgi:MFS transporter, DHA3 family, macrolide efflux protein
MRVDEGKAGHGPDRASSEVGAEPAKPDRSWTRPFLTIWTGQALSLIGSRMGGFALVWWLTLASGGSATVLATMSLLEMLPHVLLGPIVGALVDRWSRRRVMIVADSLVAAFSGLLALLAWTNRLEIWHIYGIIFIRSLGGVAHWSAMQAATPLMVPDEQLSRIAGMNQTLQGALSMITPPLGAIAMSAMSLQAVMGIDMVTAFFAVVPLLFVHIPDPVKAPGPAETQVVKGVTRDITEGFRFIWRWTGMFLVLVMAALINGTINPAFSLMPILITQHFGGDVLQLGWTQSAWGIGLILGGLLLSVWGGFKRKLLTSLLGLVLAGIAFAIVGLAPPTGFTLALVAIFFSGMMNPLVNGPFMAIVQSVVPPELQGRVFAVIGSVAGLAAPIGMVIAGPLADAYGVQLWFLIGGLISVLMGLGLGLVPAVMNLETQGKARAAEIAARLQVAYDAPAPEAQP